MRFSKKSLLLIVSFLLLICIKKQFTKPKPRNFKNLNFNTRSDLNSSIAIIIVVHNLESIATDYSISIPTIQCYAQANNYNFLIINFSDKASIPGICDKKCNHCPIELASRAEVKFNRHCIVAEYLKRNPNIDYVLALDADIGVINPNHRIEDYIDETKDLIFSERKYNYEIQAATYIAKNSNYTQKFLHSWSNKISHFPVTIANADNPALHQVLMEFNFDDERKFECKAFWKEAGSFYDVLRFIYCTRKYIGFDTKQCCDSKIKIYLSSDFSWSRDGWLTDTKFSEKDFMFHDWKISDIGSSKRSKWQNPFADDAFSFKVCSRENVHLQWKYLSNFQISQTTSAELQKAEQLEWRKCAKVPYLDLVWARLENKSTVINIPDCTRR